MAREVGFIIDDGIKQFSKNFTTRKRFEHVRIGRLSDKKKMGLKISGKGGKISENTFIFVLPSKK